MCVHSLRFFSLAVMKFYCLYCGRAEVLSYLHNCTVLKYYGLCSGSAEVLLSLLWQCWSTIIFAMKWEEWVQITYSLQWQCLSNIVFVVALLKYYLICCSWAEELLSLKWQCWSGIVFEATVLKYFYLCRGSTEVVFYLPSVHLLHHHWGYIVRPILSFSTKNNPVNHKPLLRYFPSIVQRQIIFIFL